jgi:hypothetical protein
MADNPLANATEVFSAPIEGIILALGKGIADAQSALDRNSIQTQETIDSDKVLAAYGLQATWYQFPRVELELKLALTVTEEGGPAQDANPHSAAFQPLLTAKSLRLIAQPVSAAYQNHFNYDAQASSTITLALAPVPAPRAADPATIPPRLPQDAVRDAALNSGAKFVVTTDSSGRKSPVANLRFDINFNAAARLWYVLQYDPANPSANAVVVAVDDTTGSVRILST